MHLVASIPGTALPGAPDHPGPAGDREWLEALLAHTGHVLQLFAGERLINKIFGRVMQSHAMGRLVIAHFECEAGVGERPTLKWLQEQAGCPRTLAAFVGIAKVARLLREERDPSDRRRKFLVPGERVVNGLRDWLAHHLRLAESLRLVPADATRRLRDDDAHFRRVVRHSLLVVEALAEDPGASAAWQWFEDHECGLRIAYAYLRQHCEVCLAGGLPYHRPVALTLTGAEVARLLGLSRSHVRNVVNGAERLGAIHHDERRLRARLSEAFLAEARASLLRLLGLMAEAHARAARDGTAVA